MKQKGKEDSNEKRKGGKEERIKWEERRGRERRKMQGGRRKGKRTIEVCMPLYPPTLCKSQVSAA